MSDAPPAEWFADGTVDPRKLEDYLLSPTHPVGKHKARLWRSVFGVNRGDGALLERLIREQLRQSQAEPVKKEEKEFREDPLKVVRLWEVVIPHFEGPNGNTGAVLTAWALAPEGARPWLTTAYPLL